MAVSRIEIFTEFILRFTRQRKHFRAFERQRKARAKAIRTLKEVIHAELKNGRKLKFSIFFFVRDTRTQTKRCTRRHIGRREYSLRAIFSIVAEFWAIGKAAAAGKQTIPIEYGTTEFPRKFGHYSPIRSDFIDSFVISVSQCTKVSVSERIDSRTHNNKTLNSVSAY